MKKTLLLTNSLPGTGNVGAILVQRMLNEIPELPIAIACISSSAGDEQATPYAVQHTKELYEHATPATTKRIPQLTIAAKRIAHRREFNRQIKSISNFARSNDCQCVWAILSSLNLVEVANGVATKLSSPLVTQVWDDIEYLSRQRAFHGLALRSLKKRFSTCLRNSERTAVIGETMAEDYAKNHGVNPVIVRLGASEQKQEPRDDSDASIYTITFSGGMYCYSAFQTLLRALDLCHWQCEGRPIRLCIFSNESRIESQSAANIQYLGWRSNEEVSRQLSNSDLLYLPQPFETHNYPLSRLSFPTKMSDYVATGTPILIHAPPYASLIQLRDKYPGLLSCCSLDPNELASKIRESLTDSSRREKSKQSSRRIGTELLTPRNFREGVRQLVGLKSEPQLQN